MIKLCRLRPRQAGRWHHPLIRRNFLALCDPYDSATTIELNAHKLFIHTRTNTHANHVGNSVSQWFQLWPDIRRLVLIYLNCYRRTLSLAAYFILNQHGPKCAASLACLWVIYFYDTTISASVYVSECVFGMCVCESFGLTACWLFSFYLEARAILDHQFVFSALHMPPANVLVI